MVGLAGRSGVSPRALESARTNRKVEGRRKFTNGTAGQRQVFLWANPVGSIGFRQLLVRTAKAWPVRRNRGKLPNLRCRKASSKNGLEAKGASLWDVEGLLE